MVLFFLSMSAELFALQQDKKGKYLNKKLILFLNLKISIRSYLITKFLMKVKIF